MSNQTAVDESPIIHFTSCIPVCALQEVRIDCVLSKVLEPNFFAGRHSVAAFICRLHLGM